MALVGKVGHQYAPRRRLAMSDDAHHLATYVVRVSLDAEGGIIATAVNAVVNSSVANFAIGQ